MYRNDILIFTAPHTLNTIQARINLPKRKITHAEDQMKKRGVRSRKEVLIEMIQPLAEQSKNLTELGDKIKQTKITPYYRRGILKGIIDTNNQKYRLKRLGITVERFKELTREELRLRELTKRKRNNERKRER